MQSILPFTLEELLDVFRKLMNMFKQVMEWLGILVLPEPGDYDYPTTATTEDTGA
ncbi:MAG: hypothetical protein IJK02_11815 [Clostridia bacterium]|nr:hypothetical protein [Clostridia bacterium]MBR0508952.1 hypothetical protein [Clostridia bacterium]MBR0537136.1 hypothetical protein [Clostridia bacterium]